MLVYVQVVQEIRQVQREIGMISCNYNCYDIEDCKYSLTKLQWVASLIDVKMSFFKDSR